MIIALTITAAALLIGLRLRKHINNKPMEQTDTTIVAKRVLNLIILDESGSMSGLEKTSVDGVNETIQIIKGLYEQHPEQEQLLTFITFLIEEIQITAPSLTFFLFQRWMSSAMRIIFLMGVPLYTTQWVKR